MKSNTYPPGFQKMLDFGLVEALLGRRSRRFFAGAHIPDGVFEHRSNQSPHPLTDLEKLLVVAACGGNTSWHNMIYRGDPYAPQLSNYAGAASGRVFPSAAGFQTSTTFFSDDDGLYTIDIKDAPAFAERSLEGTLEFDGFIEDVKKRVPPSSGVKWPRLQTGLQPPKRTESSLPLLTLDATGPDR